MEIYKNDVSDHNTNRHERKGDALRRAITISKPEPGLFSRLCRRGTNPLSESKLDPQLKENVYTVTVKKLTAKAREAEKPKKVAHFPKPDVFFRFFPTRRAGLQAGKWAVFRRAGVCCGGIHAAGRKNGPKRRLGTASDGGLRWRGLSPDPDRHPGRHAFRKTALANPRTRVGVADGQTEGGVDAPLGVDTSTGERTGARGSSDYRDRDKPTTAASWNSVLPLLN
jgi:hypothetical protein